MPAHQPRRACVQGDAVELLDGLQQGPHALPASHAAACDGGRHPRGAPAPRGSGDARPARAIPVQGLVWAGVAAAGQGTLES